MPLNAPKVHFMKRSFISWRSLFMTVRSFHAEGISFKFGIAGQFYQKIKSHPAEMELSPSVREVADRKADTWSQSACPRRTGVTFHS